MVLLNIWSSSQWMNESINQSQILLISAHYLHKAQLSTVSISSIPSSPPPWTRPKSCRKTSVTADLRRLDWATRPSARSLVTRWQLLVCSFGNGRNWKMMVHGMIIRKVTDPQLRPQSPRTTLVTYCTIMDWNFAVPTRSPCLSRQMYIPVLSLPVNI